MTGGLEPEALIGTWRLARTIDDRRDEDSTLTGVLGWRRTRRG